MLNHVDKAIQKETSIDDIQFQDNPNHIITDTLMDSYEVDHSSQNCRVMRIITLSKLLDQAKYFYKVNWNSICSNFGVNVYYRISSLHPSDVRLEKSMGFVPPANMYLNKSSLD